MAAEGTRLASKQASKQSIIVPFFPVKLNFIQNKKAYSVQIHGWNMPFCFVD